MKHTELIERYIYAVSRQLPAKQRADIEKELSSIINDMLEERCGDITPTEQDVNVVLAELGKPSELAAKYDPNGERSLIGPRYYRAYIRTMKLVLPVVVIGMVISAVLSMVVEGFGNSGFTLNGRDMSWLGAVFGWMGNIVTAVFTAAAFVTLVFAIFEYKGIALDEDDIAKLPKVPEKTQRIKRSDCIAGIVLTTLFTACFLFVPQAVCAVSFSDGEVARAVSIFSTDVIRSLWPFFAAMFVLSIGQYCFGLAEGVYSVRYAVVTIIANILSTAAAAIAFTRPGVMNPEFTDLIGKLFVFEPDEQFIAAAFEHFNLFLVGVWVLACVINIIEAVVKAVRYSSLSKGE